MNEKLLAIVERYLAENGMMDSEFCDRIGLARNFLIAFRRGRMVGLDTAERIVQSMNMNLDVLWYDQFRMSASQIELALREFSTHPGHPVQGLSADQVKTLSIQIYGAALWHASECDPQKTSDPKGYYESRKAFQEKMASNLIESPWGNTAHA